MDWCNSLLSTQKDDRFFEKIDEDLDLAFALSLQEEFNDDATQEVLTKEALSIVPSPVIPSSSSKPIGIVDKQWEFIDPNPDVHALFLQFNTQFFYGKLLSVEVKWSPRMTLCAGVCSYEGRGGLCSVRLSSPLLRLRPRRDLVETLLHEMIHAYLFVTANNKDHDAHGPEFLSHMYRINKQTGTNISVYHSFHDEVDHFRKHWWKCNGPCQKQRPFYGVVKRAMNRPPGPNDRWWSQHQSTCGGTFSKIKEPPQIAKRKHSKESTVPKNSTDIKSFFNSNPSTSKAEDISNIQTKRKKGEADIHTIKSIFEKENNLVSVNSSDSIQTSVPAFSSPKKITAEIFSGKGFTLGSSSSSVKPISLLSQIRKEIGYPNSRTATLNSSKQISNVSKISTSKKSSQTSSTKTVIQSSASSNKKQQNTNNSISKKGNSSFLGDFQSSTKKLTQSSIDSFVTSPERVSGKESNKVSIATSIGDTASNVKTVPCPVCFSDVPSETINAHLDSCLNTCL